MPVDLIGVVASVEKIFINILSPAAGLCSAIALPSLSTTGYLLDFIGLTYQLHVIHRRKKNDSTMAGKRVTVSRVHRCYWSKIDLKSFFLFATVIGLSQHCKETRSAAKPVACGKMAHPHPLRFVFPFRDFPGKLGNTYFDTEVEIIYFTLLHVLRSQAIPGYHNENSLILFAAVFYQEGFHSTSSITVAKQWHQGQSPRRAEPCHRGATQWLR